MKKHVAYEWIRILQRNAKTWWKHNFCGHLCLLKLLTLSHWLMSSTGNKVKYQALWSFYYHSGGNFHDFIWIDRLISHICYRLIKTSCLLSGRWFFLSQKHFTVIVLSHMTVTRMPSSNWRQLASIILNDKHIGLQWNSETIYCKCKISIILLLRRGSFSNGFHWDWNIICFLGVAPVPSMETSPAHTFCSIQNFL